MAPAHDYGLGAVVGGGFGTSPFSGPKRRPLPQLSACCQQTDQQTGGTGSLESPTQSPAGSPSLPWPRAWSLRGGPCLGGSFTLIFHLILRAGTVDRTFHIRKGIFTSKESSHLQASCKEARRNYTCLLPSNQSETTQRPSEPRGAGTGTGTPGLTFGRALQGGRGEGGEGSPGRWSSAVSLQHVWRKALHIVLNAQRQQRLSCQRLFLQGKP